MSYWTGPFGSPRCRKCGKPVKLTDADMRAHRVECWGENSADIWTHTKPTEQGWYWLRRYRSPKDHACPDTIVFVLRTPQGLFINDGQIVASAHWEDRWQWQGPLKPRE